MTSVRSQMWNSQCDQGQGLSRKVRIQLPKRGSIIVRDDYQEYKISEKTGIRLHTAVNYVDKKPGDQDSCGGDFTARIESYQNKDQP
ncbi:hypothetical protein Tco_0018352 [Tanacetum coccineum]